MSRLDLQVSSISELVPRMVRAPWGRRWRSLPSARKAGPPHSGTAAFSIGTGVWGREAWPWQTEEPLMPKERFCSLFPQRPFLLSFQLEQSCNCRIQRAAFCLCCRGDISCRPRYLAVKATNCLKIFSFQKCFWVKATFFLTKMPFLLKYEVV